MNKKVLLRKSSCRRWGKEWGERRGYPSQAWQPWKGQGMVNIVQLLFCQSSFRHWFRLGVILLVAVLSTDLPNLVRGIHDENPRFTNIFFSGTFFLTRSSVKEYKLIPLAGNFLTLTFSTNLSKFGSQLQLAYLFLADNVIRLVLPVSRG